MPLQQGPLKSLSSASFSVRSCKILPLSRLCLLFQQLNFLAIKSYRSSTALSVCDLASFFFFFRLVAGAGVGAAAAVGRVVWLSAFSHLAEAPLICHDYCRVLACHWLQEINGSGLPLCCMGQSNGLFLAKWGFPSTRLFIPSILLSICTPFFSLCHALPSQFINWAVHMPISFQESGCSRAGSLSGGEKRSGVRSQPHVNQLAKESFVLFWGWNICVYKKKKRQSDNWFTKQACEMDFLHK